MKNKMTEPMDCKKVRSLLRQYLFDELGAEEHGRVQGHLLECEACSQAFYEQVDAALRMGELPQVSMPAPVVSEAETKPPANIMPPGKQPGSSFSTPGLFRGLARGSREIATVRLAFSLPADVEVISLDGGEFTVTVSAMEKQQTRVQLEIKANFKKENERRRYMIYDAEDVELLSGRVQDGEVVATVDSAFASIRSPLLVKIFA